MQTVGQRYRWGIYGLLGAVILAGVALSTVMARKADSVRHAIAPLLDERIPMIRHLADFEHTLLVYQLSLNKYATQSIDRDRFQTEERDTRGEMSSNLTALNHDFEGTPYMTNIRVSYEELLPLARLLAAQLEDGKPDADTVHVLLVRINLRTDEIRAQLSLLKQGTITGLNEAEIIANSSVDAMAAMVHAYTLLTLLVSVFLMYHVRARVRSERQLAFQASHDPLTDLANRRSFQHRLQTLSGHPCTLVLAMIDRFERVAGGLGYTFADRLMREMAERIRETAESHRGEVFRLDGAKFAILYPATTPREALEAVRAAMRQPFHFDQHEVLPSLSMGSAVCPGDGADMTQVQQNADAALRAARDAGGNTLVAYTPVLGQKTQQSLQWEAQLGHAIERDELELHYQPQEHLGARGLLGFEALLRWKREGKMVPPGDFIPLAEESGLIIPIGDWVLTQACRRAKQWQERFGPRDLVIAVNISPRQIAHPGFLRRLREILAETGADPAGIELEITENVVMQDAQRSNSLLQELRRLGLKLAIDDFGTGYSSLAYLTRFPVDKLKIDQSFIRHLRPANADAAIVQAMIHLGHDLGLAVIAEGVETEEQRALLREWGCDEIQGYWYGRPMPVADAETFLEENPPLRASACPSRGDARGPA